MKILILVALLSLSSFANLGNCNINFYKPETHYNPVEIGSKLELEIEGFAQGGITHQFLGRMRGFDGEDYKYLFLNPKSRRIEIANANKVSVKFWTYKGEAEFLSYEGAFTEFDAQSFIRPSTQGRVGHCMGHSLTNCVLNYDFKKHNFETKNYGHLLEDEASRHELLSRLVGEVHDVDSGAEQMTNMKKFMQNELGFELYHHDESNIQSFYDEVKKHLGMGWFVYVGFDIKPNMTRSSFSWHKTDEVITKDINLWLPRERGEGSAGRHGIFLIDYFQVEGIDPYFLVLDPNHRYPVLWHYKTFNQALSAHMEAVTVWQKEKPNSL